MTFHVRNDSLIDAYEALKPDSDPYTKVYEERDELREQNKQLWRIIEKQRLIIFQLQKLLKSNSEGKKKAKGDAHSIKKPTLEKKASISLEAPEVTENTSPIMEPQKEALKAQAHHSEEKEEITSPPVSIEDYPIEEEYSKAQKRQSMLQEKYEDLDILDKNSKSSIYNTNPSAQSSIKEIHENYQNNQTKQIRDLEVFTKTNKTLHKASSDSKLALSNPNNAIHAYTSVSKNPSNSTENNDTKNSIPQNINPKLMVPPRSSLRNRSETTSSGSKPRKILTPISEKEERLNAPTNRIPDLRKGKTQKYHVNKDDVDNKLSNSSQDESNEDKLVESSLTKNNSNKLIANKSHRSLSESSVLTPSINSVKQESLKDDISDTDSDRLENLAHSKSPSLCSIVGPKRNQDISEKSNSEQEKNMEPNPYIDQGISETLEAISEVSSDDDLESKNLLLAQPSDQIEPGLSFPQPPLEDPSIYSLKSKGSSVNSSLSDFSSFDPNKGFIINNVDDNEPFRAGKKLDKKTRINNRPSEFDQGTSNILDDLTIVGPSELLKEESNILDDTQIDEIDDTVDPMTFTSENESESDSNDPKEGSDVLDSSESYKSKNKDSVLEHGKILSKAQGPLKSKEKLTRSRTSKSFEGVGLFKPKRSSQRNKSLSIMVDKKKDILEDTELHDDTSLSNSDSSTDSIIAKNEDFKSSVDCNDPPIELDAHLLHEQIHSSIPKSPAVGQDVKDLAIFIQKQYKKIKLTVSPFFNDPDLPDPTLDIAVYGVPSYKLPNDTIIQHDQQSLQKISDLRKNWSQIIKLDAKFRKELPPKLLNEMPSLDLNLKDSMQKPLEAYFEKILLLDRDIPPSSSPGAIWLFLVSDQLLSHMAPSNEPPSVPVVSRQMFKAGYLLKRGKKLGKLKLRYFVLKDVFLEYYESEEGSYLGSINLFKAQILKSTVATLHSEQYDQYIYAITILENKKGSILKHVFFINNPKDWDEWLFMLDYYSRQSDSSKHNPNVGQNELKILISHESNKSQKEAISNQATSPTRSSKNNGKNDVYPSTSGPNSSTTTFQNYPESSILDKITKKNKKVDFGENIKQMKKDQQSNPLDKKQPTKPVQRKTFHWNTKNFFTDAFQKRSNSQLKVFGVPLEQSILKGSIKSEIHLPAVVYRCIEYLEKYKAFLEEGIYRLSGSSADIQTLKEKFDHDGDYNLLKSSKRYDVHTIAGLLKLYFREMPTFILTSELQPMFVKAIDLPERNQKVNKLGKLVCDLPLPNYTTLRTLIAHLIRIVEKSDINKMTLRNLGIVFVPTLAIPAGVFSLMLLEFEHIFWVNEFGNAAPKRVSTGYIGSYLTQEIEGVPGPSVGTVASEVANPDMETGWRNNRNSILYRDNMPEEIRHQEHGLDIKGEPVDHFELQGEEIEVSSIDEFTPTQYPPNISDGNLSSMLSDRDTEDLTISDANDSNEDESTEEIQKECNDIGESGEHAFIKENVNVKLESEAHEASKP